MKKIIFGLTLLAAAGASPTVSAAIGSEPVITFTTSVVSDAGTSTLTLYLGSTTAQTVAIDGGNGRTEFTVEPATYDSETMGIKSTAVTTEVSSAGVVRIYAEDASLIDYLDCEGCYIHTIAMPTLTNLDVLTMNHNVLEELDLEPFSKLSMLSLNDNPFDKTPLKIGAKPELAILNLDIVKNMDPSFTLTEYPALQSFTAWANQGISYIDPTQCPLLQRLSVDNTSVSSVDVSKNPELLILNVSDTRVRQLDLSKCPKLQQLYCQHRSSTVNPDIKITSLDLSHNPDLLYLYCTGNLLTSLDLSANTRLMMFDCSFNNLTRLDLSNNPNLINVDYSYNYMDYATMPQDPGTWSDLIWQQHPMKVEYSYPVGATIDLRDRVVINAAETYISMRGYDRTKPGEDYEIEEDAYTYADGVVTLHKAIADSVRLEFYNPVFPDATLNTTKFMVKSEEEYGKPTAVTSFTSALPAGKRIELSIGVLGASEATPKTVYLDLGGDTLSEFTVTTQNLPATPNVSAEVISSGIQRILVPDGVNICALGIHTQLYSIDVSGLSQLIDLDLSGCKLYSIDLQYNNLLNRLSLADNNLYTINLEGYNNAFNKQWLSDIDLSDNMLTTFEVPDNRTLVSLNLSNNRIPELSFRDADNLTMLDLSGNELELLDVHYSLGLSSLNAAGNKLSEIILPDGTVLDNLNLSDNAFTFASLPEPSAAMTYAYAPQQNLSIPTIGPSVNLKAQYLTIAGHTTEYAWYKADGTPCSLGTDYTLENGRTTFLNTDMGDVYCVMTNGAFPALELTTSKITPAPMPTNVVASFTTPVGGQTAQLSLAAASGNPAIYFDWSGEGDFEQYSLGDTYRLFSATTVKDATVKVYTYGDEDRIKVFSITDVTMGEFDGSALKDVTCLTLANAYLSTDKLILPPNPALDELNLTGCDLDDSLDLSRYTNMRNLYLSNNRLTRFDFSPFKALQVSMVDGNYLTDVTLDNPLLWGLSLNNNRLSAVDLSKATALEQLGLANNEFETIDVSPLSRLIAFNLVGNRFNFATLPLRQDSWFSYSFLEQADINVQADGEKVDLSFTAEAQDGTETEYAWYTERPELDENGILQGNLLEEGTAYTLEDGVTTFLGRYPQVVCVMTNAAFDGLYLYTEPLDMSGLGEVSADSLSVAVANGTVSVSSTLELPVALYTINGTLVGKATVRGTAEFSHLATGVYILVTPAGPYRLLVK